MSKLYHKLIEHAEAEAAHGNVKRRIGSYFKDKTEKWKKPRGIAQGATTILTNLIPIPGVGTGVSFVEGKISSLLTEHYRKWKMKVADDNEDLKTQIKNIDINAIDRGRKKVDHNIDMFNDLYRCISEKIKGMQPLPCSDMYALAYRYCRVQNRLKLLRGAAQSSKDAMACAIDYCDDADKSIKKASVENILVGLCERHDEKWNTCGEGCLNLIMTDDECKNKPTKYSKGSAKQERNENVEDPGGSLQQTQKPGGYGGEINKKKYHPFVKKLKEIEENTFVLMKKTGTSTGKFRDLMKKKMGRTQSGINDGNPCKPMPTARNMGGGRCTGKHHQMTSNLYKQNPPTPPSKPGKFMTRNYRMGMIIGSLIEKLQSMEKRWKGNCLKPGEKEVIEEVCAKVGAVMDRQENGYDRFDMMGRRPDD